VCVLDREGRIVRFNQACEELSGYSVDEVRGRPYWELLLAPEDVPAVRAHTDAAADFPNRSENAWITRSGERRIISWTNNALRNARGELELMIGTGIDVTELRETQEALRAVEKRSRLLIEHLPGVVYTSELGEHGRWRYVSPFIETLLGYTAEEWKADPGLWSSLLHPEDRERVVAYDEQAFRVGDTYTAEYRLITRDGRTVWVRDLGGIAADEQGEPHLVHGFLFDVTERKQTEDALREAHHRLETYVEASPVALVTWDSDGRILSWNPAAERMFGWSAADVVGRLRPIVPDDRLAEWREVRDRVFAGEAVHDIETWRRCRDGTLVDVSMSVAPLRGDAGDVVAGLSVIADISRRKLAESRLRESEAQLRQSQKMEAVGRLAGGIAHDFNNLLTAIIGHSQLLLADLAPEDRHSESVREIAGAADRAASLTRQLLAYSRRQVLQPKVMSLSDVVGGLETMLRRLLGEHIEFSVTLDQELSSVIADPGQVEQVLLNLAVSARDAMPQGGRLAVRTAITNCAEAFAVEGGLAPAGRYATLEVADTGSGMDEETRTRAFEPFFTTKGPGEGTGLGLSMVYGIVSQSGGYLEVSTAPGEGTTMRVHLPLAELSAAQAGAPAAPPSPVAAVGRTVLLVEDDAAVRRVTREMLERGGFSVLEATSGNEAVSLLDVEDAIDLLVSDVVMPGLSGPELAALARERHPDLRVLYVSGYHEVPAVARGQRRGERFLQKPFSVADLSEAVAALLRDRE
jgi:PAS domain S-box-containing protein